MTDEETAAKIVEDNLNGVCETSLEAAIVRALRAARHPVAYEVPGFHIASGGGVASWTATYARWSDIQPDDFRIFDVRRVLCEGANRD